MRKPINTEPDGSCKTIKAQYYKNGVANFVRGGHYGATGVIEYYENRDSSNKDWMDYPSQSLLIITMQELQYMSKIMVLGYVWKNQQNGAVYDFGGLSPCLNCGCHSGVEPKIMVYYEAGNDMSEQQGEW